MIIECWSTTSVNIWLDFLPYTVGRTDVRIKLGPASVKKPLIAGRNTFDEIPMEMWRLQFFFLKTIISLDISNSVISVVSLSTESKLLNVSCFEIGRLYSISTVLSTFLAPVDRTGTEVTFDSRRLAKLFFWRVIPLQRINVAVNQSPISTVSKTWQGED